MSLRQIRSLFEPHKKKRTMLCSSLFTFVHLSKIFGHFVLTICTICFCDYISMVLKGIFLIKKPDWPNKICSSITEAEKWAESLLLKE